MTTVAIMQPYLFPYIGYYQLVAAADTFVFLDDVNFRKGSFINRNYIIDTSGKVIRFTLPVQNQSANKKINEHVYADPGDKPIKTFNQCYGNDDTKSGYRAIFKQIVRESAGENLAEVNANSIRLITQALGVNTEHLVSSEIDPNPAEKGASRVLSLCKQVGASRYLNLPGGKALYDSETFAAQGVELRFLTPPRALPASSSESDTIYPSFLHHLMTLDDHEVQNQLTKIELD